MRRCRWAPARSPTSALPKLSQQYTRGWKNTSGSATVSGGGKRAIIGSGDCLLRFEFSAQGVQHDLNEVTRYTDIGVAGCGVLRGESACQGLCFVETAADAQHVTLHRDGAVEVPAAGVFADVERALDGRGGGRAVLAVKNPVRAGQM